MLSFKSKIRNVSKKGRKTFIILCILLKGFLFEKGFIKDGSIINIEKLYYIEIKYLKNMPG
jgi:hypothetical protein